MGRKIEVRSLKLNKWYVPKTFQLENVNKYVAIGYFDSIQFEAKQVDPSSEQPFMHGYRQMIAWKKEEKLKLVDYSSQEQMLFTDICESKEDEDGICFAQESIYQFWDLKSQYLFLSMVHINHIGNVELVRKKSRKYFNKIF